MYEKVIAMKVKIKEKVKEIRRNIVYSSARDNIRNKDFTIISNNCWGGTVYQDLNISYKSPFVGMFIMSPDYLKLLKNLDYYLSQELTFSKKSKYEEINKKRETDPYPIGNLDDVELALMHYKSEEEAKDKWDRRKKRMNLENIFVKACEQNGSSWEFLREFDELPYENKVVFTAKDYHELKNAVYFKDFSTKREMNHYHKYFDFVSWLNDGEIIRKYK